MARPGTEYKSSRITYINGVVNRLISGVAEFFRTDLVPRCHESNGGGGAIISTYSKAVEHFTNRKFEAGERWSRQYPYLVVDPSFEFLPEQSMTNFFYSYPHMHNIFGSKSYGPDLYRDDNIRIAPVVNRYVGNIDIYLYCGSVYELIDLRTNIIQFFTGMDRPIYPFSFESLLIVPDELENLEYSNPFTGSTYTLDWDSSESKCQRMLIRNINSNKIVCPLHIRPWLYLRGISEDMERYGGGDILGDHRLILNIEWECAIPVHTVTITDRLPIPEIPMEFTMYMDFKPLRIPALDKSIQAPSRFISVSDFGTEADTWQRHPERFNDPYFERTEEKVEYRTMLFDKYFNYVLDQQDVDDLTVNDANIQITIPYTMPIDERFVKVHLMNAGWVERDSGFRISEDRLSIEILYPYLKDTIELDQVITIVLYKPEVFT